MCGYACIRCGQCGKKFADTPQLGTCPKCGELNELGVVVCRACGKPLPPKPGAGLSATAGPAVCRAG